MEPVSSLCGWLLVGREVLPPVFEVALPLKVAPLAIHFRGAIVDLEENFWEGFGREILSVGTQISVKVPNIEVNFSEEFIYTQFVRGKVEQCKHQRIYVKNLQREKTMGQERDSTKSKGLQWVLNPLL